MTNNSEYKRLYQELLNRQGMMQGDPELYRAMEYKWTIPASTMPYSASWWGPPHQFLFMAHDGGTGNGTAATSKRPRQ